jgi:drug/metabolite transporter (DMT)-like permease
MTTVAAVLILITAVLTGQNLLSPHGRDWALLLFLAVFPGTLGHFLSNWAHPHVPAFLLSVMLLAVPVIAVASAAALLDEHVSLVQAAGAAIMLAAIWTIVRSTSETTAEELAESVAETDAP